LANGNLSRGQRRRCSNWTIQGAATAKHLEEQQSAELVACTEELWSVLEEAPLAREAANTAEEKRVEVIKAAEEATKPQMTRH
jgi:hypothetical protein